MRGKHTWEGVPMGKTYSGTGTAENGVIRLDDASGLPQGRVRVTVEKTKSAEGHSVFDIPPAPDGGRPAKELLAELRALRDEWDRDWDRSDEAEHQ